MDPLIYSSKFIVKGHDVNVNQYLTLPNLMKYLQEASLQHARNLKTSVWDMADEQISWVLIRKELNVLKPLILDESYHVLTYPSGFEKFFAYRDYLVFDNDNKLVVTASSTWTLINTSTRKLNRIPASILEIGVPKNTRFLKRPPKLDADMELKKSIDIRKIRPYDLDWNNHVNNIVLFRYLIEPLKGQGIEDEFVEKLIVQFKNEVTLNQSLQVFLDDLNNKKIVKLINMKDDLEIACCLFECKENL